jgi:selenide,water dikinase
VQVLHPLEKIFNPEDYPDLLVGLSDPDDASVWRLDEQRALVMTTDFFTPVVDDPYTYGAIAAANSFSDVYAMGAKPFLALNIAALPPDLPPEVLSEIIRGGGEKAREAGAVIAGGHTVQDKEPKYGLVVIGMVDIPRVMTKGGAHPGDRLVLTKPLGFGAITTAIKQEKASQEDILEVVEWMMKLNRSASELGVAHGVRGATDITGFGLMGHSWEVAQASRARLILDYDRIPFLDSAMKYGYMHTFAGGAFDNLHYYGSKVQIRKQLDEVRKMLLFDPQTSGGLLLAVPAKEIDSLKKRAATIELPVWEIGEVAEGAGVEVV